MAVLVWTPHASPATEADLTGPAEVSTLAQCDFSCSNRRPHIVCSLGFLHQNVISEPTESKSRWRSDSGFCLSRTVSSQFQALAVLHSADSFIVSFLVFSRCSSELTKDSRLRFVVDLIRSPPQVAAKLPLPETATGIRLWVAPAPNLRPSCISRSIFGKESSTTTSV
ncbi:hypothetical protein BT63DRAFT_296734 [Microthyrium microscopicum]|uniref:Uncharacterized protein n=1 Tax=Microthyrium microscopicum TaxID=703497 RepID=A0A6A6U6R1_9PEZI|nr:hypothetical protein BT63DRAFT_296734 [Microthyrium microscopicum]